MGELRGRSLFAWVLVCVLWGSTYLGIRVAVESLPPFLMAGFRYGLAGIVLGGFALLRGEKLPAQPSDWRTLSLVGVLLLAGGNGLVVWAEQFVDAGTASIYVVTVAIWAAIFDAAWPGGTTRFTGRIAAGLVLGFAGSFVLTGVTPSNFFSVDFRGPVALVLASASWAFGTVYLKRHKVATPFTMASAVQMTAGAIGLTLIGLLLGETGRWHPSTEGWLAVAYLIVFGSIVGFTAYGYALRHASATVVGTYAYVNPVVAVLLGALILGEELSARKILAMAIILGAVFWIQSAVSPARVRRTQPA